MLEGLQSRWFAWHGWSVLTPDLPGHHDSEGAPLPTLAAMAAWVRQLMDAAQLQHATLIDHSMGAIVALQTAADLPDRVEHLALLGVADAMSVHPDLLMAAQADDPLAFDLITAWGHGRNAHLGGNAQPGIWLLGAPPIRDGRATFCALARPHPYNLSKYLCDGAIVVLCFLCIDSLGGC